MEVYMKCAAGIAERFAIVISPQLLMFWDNSSEPWGVKNIESRYAYANKAYYDLINIKQSLHNIEGSLDDQLPSSIAEFAWHFKEHDRSTLQVKDRLCSLEIHRYGSEQLLQPYYFDKFPLFDHKIGKCIGTIFHARKFEHFSLLKHINGERPTFFCFFPPEQLFSDGELDVIFYALQSMSSKIIAKKLDLSFRTIENRLLVIYKKAGVHCLSGLVDFCRAKGFDRYIPQKFFCAGSQLINAYPKNRPLMPVSRSHFTA